MAFMFANRPPTPALSPEGRGGDGYAPCVSNDAALSVPASPRPSGERARVRGL
jgi:hypothetical protein